MTWPVWHGDRLFGGGGFAVGVCGRVLVVVVEPDGSRRVLRRADGAPVVVTGLEKLRVRSVGSSPVAWPGFRFP